MRMVILFFLLMGFSLPAFSKPEIGSMPALVVQDMDGGVVDISKLRGKVVLVQFWATWCPDCRAEMPGLDAYYRSHHAKGLEIVAVSIDKPEKREKVKEVMQKFSYRTVMADGIKSNDFGWPAEIPLVYVLDKKGVLRYEAVADGRSATLENVDGMVNLLLDQ